jgi:hypothetical protein
MSIFGSIIDRIFHHSAQAATPGTQPGSSAGTTSTQQSQSPSTQAGGSQRLQSVDVDAVLGQLAAKKGGGGNYRTSIVDLLKLLDLDSSLDARKQLASELNVHAGGDGTAEQNIALQKAVMNKLAENGGKVPDSLRN